MIAFRNYEAESSYNNVFFIEQWCKSVLMEKLKGLVLKT